MAETARGYARWQGRASPASRVLTIAGGELRRARRSTWAVLAAGGALAWGLASALELYQVRSGGAATHDPAGFWAMLDQLRWFILAVAAVVGGPALLDDHRRGALELYLSRPVTRWDHLLGKSLAVLGLCVGLFAASIAAYAAAAYALFPEQPAGWALQPLSGLVYALLWCFLAAGLALGVSCLAPSGRAAALVLFGGAVTLHLVATSLLPQLTEADWSGIFSPFGGHDAIRPWLWDAAPEGPFPPWWGLVETLALAAAGWGLVAWRHPRLRGATDA